MNIQKMSHPLACALEILERTLTERVRLVEGMCTNRENGLVTDYVSNAVLNLIEEIVDGDVTEATCQELQLLMYK